MANLSKTIAGLIAPTAVAQILANQDPKTLGKEAGNGLRRIVEAQIGPKAYIALSKGLIAWFDALYVAVRKELL